jgi:hypothetical protein
MIDYRVRRRGYILFFLIILHGAQAFSQQLSHQVIVPAASVIYKNGISYSQTIGEAAVEIISSPDYILTQGFQQPRIRLIPGKPDGTGVKAYPNPATSYVYIELFGERARSFRIIIMSINGTTLHSEEISYDGPYWDIRDISVSGLASGLYFVQVTSKDGAILRSFKIEKM